MNAWMMLWMIVLLGALVLFSCLTVAVTIGGFLDIRKMLRQVVRQHEFGARARAERDESQDGERPARDDG